MFNFRTSGAKLQKNIRKKYFISNNQKWPLWFVMGTKRISWKEHFSNRFYSMPIQATFSTANNSRIDRNLSGKKNYLSVLGVIQNYMDRILPFFDPTLLRGQFIFWAWTKTDIFDPLPTSSSPRSYWMAPYLSFSVTVWHSPIPRNTRQIYGDRQVGFYR